MKTNELSKNPELVVAAQTAGAHPVADELFDDFWSELQRMAGEEIEIKANPRAEK